MDAGGFSKSSYFTSNCLCSQKPVAKEINAKRDNNKDSLRTGLRFQKLIRRGNGQTTDMKFEKPTLRVASYFFTTP